MKCFNYRKVLKDVNHAYGSIEVNYSFEEPIKTGGRVVN